MADGGGTISEVYQALRRSLLRARGDVERVERTGGDVPSSEFFSSLRWELAEIGSTCRQMDRLWRFVAAKPHRILWKRLVCTCSSEKDICSCQCRCIKDVAHQRLDSTNRYQTMKVTNSSVSFMIGSDESDGIPPQFLRRAERAIYRSVLLPPCPRIPEAKGLNAALRAKLPKLDFDVSIKRSKPVVVGEWYCPFIFIREFGGLDHPKAQNGTELSIQDES